MNQTQPDGSIASLYISITCPRIDNIINFFSNRIILLFSDVQWVRCRSWGGGGIQCRPKIHRSRPLPIVTPLYYVHLDYITKLWLQDENEIDIPGGPPKKRNSRYSRFFRTCSDQQLSFFTLLDRASFPHHNNTKIIKFG